MKHPLLKFLLLVIFLLAALAGLAWYLLNDSSFVKGQLSTRLEQATGWQLEIPGELDVSWGKNSVIEAHGIRLVNPSWKGDPLLFSAGHLRLELEPLGLLDKRLVMNELILGDCVVRYAKNDVEAVNWSLAKEREEPKKPKDPKESDFTWNLSKLNITACQASIDRSSQDKPMNILFSEAAFELDEKDTLTASVDGSVDQQPLALKGQVSPLTAMWQGGQLEHEIHLKAGENALHSNGSVEDFTSGDGANLKFQFTGPEIRNIEELLGLPEFSDGPFDARIDLKENLDTGFMDIGIDGDLGSLQIKGSGKLDRLVLPSSGSVDIHFKGPNLDALGRLLGQEWLIEKAYELELIADIKDSKTQLDSFWLQAGDNRFSATGHLGAWPQLLGSKLEVKVQSSDMSEWQPAAQDGFSISGPLNSTVNLSVGPKREVLIDGTNHLGGGTLIVKGSLGTLDKLGDPRGSVVLEAPSLEKFALILGNEDLPDLPFKLTGDLQHQGDELQLQSIELDLAGDRLLVSGKLHLAQKLQGSNVNARLILADLASSGQRFGIDDLPAQAFTMSAKFSRTGNGLNFDVEESDLGGISIKMVGQVPDIDRPFVMTSRFDLDLPTLKLAEFFLPGQDLPDLPFSAKGEALIKGEDQMQIQGLELLLGQSRASIEANMQLGAGLAGSTATVSLQGGDIRELWAGAPAELKLGPFSLDVNWQRKTDGDYFSGVKLDLNLLKLEASGHVPDLSKPKRFDATAALSGKDASKLNALTGQPLSADPFDIKFQLVGKPELLSFTEIDYQQGKTDISGALDVNLQSRPKLSGSLKSAVLDVSPWQQQAIDKQEQEEAAGTAQSQDGSRVFSDDEFDPAAKIPLDLDLDIRVDRLLLVNNEVNQITLGLLMEKGQTELQPFEFMGMQGGHYKGKLLIATHEGVSDFHFQADVENLKLSLGGGASIDPENLPPSDVTIDLTGKGKSWQEVARALNGKIYWYAGSGIVSNSSMNFFFSDLLTEIFSSLNPLSKKSNITTLNCGVIAAVFGNEQILVEPLVIQTDQITAFSDGSINLANEEIDLSFRSVARKGLGISAGSVINPFFRIGGTLAQPALELDAARGIVSGGTMVATAGLSLLYKSVSDRFLSSKDPCGDARGAIESRNKDTQ